MMTILGEIEDYMRQYAIEDINDLIGQVKLT
jgi:hypothetical protein